MKTDNLNPFLDNLFAEARVEVPMHSFAETEHKLLAGLAIGGAGLLSAKFITSSILKSKFFIMSISAVTILTSTVLVYTTALKPAESIVNNRSENKVESATTSTPMGNELPDDLFLAAMPDVEPDDTTIIIKKDSVVDVQEIIDEVMMSLNIEEIDGSVEEILETISNVHIDIESDELFSSIAIMIDNFESSDIDISEDELLELKLLKTSFSGDSLQMGELISFIKDLEISGARLAERAREISLNKREVIINKQKASTELYRRVYTITNETTDLDLEEFNRMATAAGMDVRYNCRVWAGKIKMLDMHLEIQKESFKYTTDISIRKVKRNKSFVHNIIWFENTEGEAIKFNNINECTDNTNHKHSKDEKHSKNNYYNHSDCD